MIATHGYRTVISMFLILAALFAWSAEGQTDSYDILLTNDDGIESPGIQVLAKRLRSLGRVHVVAPCGQRSGSSMSVALRDDIRLRPVQRDGDSLGHCVDTTPAGAVMLAITSLAPATGFDLVVSGINRGANVGTASHMSGTVGGAMMGAFYRVPAVAVSLGERSGDFDYSARFVAAFVEELKHRPPMPGIVLSINIPRASQAEIEGVTVAKMGGIHLLFEYDEIEKDGIDRRFRPLIGPETTFPTGSDTEAFMRNSITITPLLFDWTAHAALDQLSTWDFTHELSASRVRPPG